MDYINKYKVNLNTNQKQVQVHTASQTIVIPMEDQFEKIRIICRMTKSKYLNPYKEKRFKIVSQMLSEQLLFSPAYHITHIRGLIIPHSLNSIKISYSFYFCL